MDRHRRAAHARAHPPHRYRRVLLVTSCALVSIAFLGRALASAVNGRPVHRVVGHRVVGHRVVGRGELVRAGDSKTACVFTGAGDWHSGLLLAEAATGLNFQCLETFSDADPTWSQWTDPWISHGDSGLPAWVAGAPSRRTVIVSQDLIPQSLSNNNDPLTWEQPCDAGRYNGYAASFARALVRSGLGYSVIRLGKEMNGGWEQDYVGATTVAQRAWARCFAEEVTAMRSVRGAHLLFDWNPNTCTNAIPLANFYPGNAYVDIIGADTYDASCLTQLPEPSLASWHRLLEEPYGLAAIARFAEQRHRPMSIPEWGLVTARPGLGDDPYYIAGIASFVRSHDVAFQAYFDSGNDGIAPLGSTTPHALATYKHAFA